ncbi:MAG: histidine kinase [Bacteroidales bacterium]|nr:histidine kinase [Bacteroidales bacterium]
MDSLRKKENKVYLFIWVFVFAFTLLPILYAIIMGYDDLTGFLDIHWHWFSLIPFVLLFLIHNYLILPLVERRKKWPYICSTAALLIVFGIYCLTAGDLGESPAGPEGPGGPPEDGMRPIPPEWLRILIGILIIGVNIGIRSIFKWIRSEHTIRELQTESVKKQLEYLQFQINPHFFMNTLNNIHALVDIDPEKAKESITEFSRMMRTLLYDTDKPTIPLAKEVSFLKSYLSLMKLRYPESVRISYSVTSDCDGAEVPVLAMSSILENAFKHGISYEKDSFVELSVDRKDGRVILGCRNSRISWKEHNAGIGNDNLKKRMDLLYGKDYSVKLTETDDVYEIVLSFPEKPSALQTITEL